MRLFSSFCLFVRSNLTILLYMIFDGMPHYNRSHYRSLSEIAVINCNMVATRWEKLYEWKREKWKYTADFLLRHICLFVYCLTFTKTLFFYRCLFKPSEYCQISTQSLFKCHWMRTSIGKMYEINSTRYIVDVLASLWLR